ncbi:MAG: epoxyqueuosine reductase [Candidatus Abyssobacteria bacterium SURF_17]|uniref:Epoxyqueuosine reductase n=1 Tax=Candidatus Abyssobacteria bacterium SURF_17 TaxID=2093361 RepID=A0A419ES54_9BACT|nr:MAG: epoxyqueuosine reductase [Candidatus Abyssubacteria bacterium SURF_17]
MDTLTQSVVNKLLDWGADLVGIAPVERFANAPEGHKPTDFLPECKSVISIALHIFQGMADVWGEYDEPGKSITPYLFYGYGLTNLESSRIVNRMARQLEYQGYKTLCFMPTWISSSYKYFDEMLNTHKVRAEFSHRHAAAASGIVDLGWNGLGLSPEFGPMQRFNSILTSAELEPTPLYNGPALCRPKECGMKCVRLCPASAFSETESQSLTIDGKKITYSTHDNIRCMYAILGMVKGSGGRTDLQIPDGPGQPMHFYSELHGDSIHMYDRGMLDNCFGIICGDFCGKCLHKCPSRKLTAKDMKEYDLSKRHSSVNRAALG